MDPPPPEVERRFSEVRATPFINNDAAAEGVKARRPEVGGLGPVLRVAEWNINRLEKPGMVAAFSDGHEYERLAEQNPKLGGKQMRRALEQVRDLQGADVIVLDEIDDGVKRSQYHNVPRDLAKSLHMNYAFAVEFVELNSIYMAERRWDAAKTPAEKRNWQEAGVDPSRDLALEGTAILSRYPILSVRVADLPAEYDWYHGEIGAISNIEKAEKWSAKKIFDEQLARQVRRGGRIVMVVRLAVPGIPSGVLTVVCPHLEDYTTPRGRREQAQTVLAEIKTTAGPLISGGDWNTIGRDGAPVTAHRLIKDYLANYKFWAREIFYFVVPVPGLSYAVDLVNYVKNFRDPTALNIPVLAPNRSEHLFRDVHNFQFADGSRFDWAGYKRASFRHKGRTLSVTSERAWKGFAPTFSYRRTYSGLVGKKKIDWIFVKQPPASEPAHPAADDLRPHYGRTLCDLNQAMPDRISDHCPSTLEFPLR